MSNSLIRSWNYIAYPLKAPGFTSSFLVGSMLLIYLVVYFVCLHPVSCIPNVASIWIVFILCLVYLMLPVSLDCLHPVSCVPNVASVSGLSSSCVLYA